jgi:hypothetical protein
MNNKRKMKKKIKIKKNKGLVEWPSGRAPA